MLCLNGHRSGSGSRKYSGEQLRDPVNKSNGMMMTMMWFSVRFFFTSPNAHPPKQMDGVDGVGL